MGTTFDGTSTPLSVGTGSSERVLLGGGRSLLKGNCHCHTNYSDGRYSPQETVCRYREAGYDFLFLTEHCDKLDGGRLPDFDALDTEHTRVLPGIEYRCTAVRGERTFEVHILGLNTVELSHWKRGAYEQDTIDAINQDGGLAILAHPYWNARTIEDMACLRGVCGIEVFNSSVDSVNAKGLAVVQWEQLLERGARLYALAVDDLHADPHRPSDFGLGWIVVGVDRKSPEAIVAAIREGTFYSSCGPEIDEWTLQGDRMRFRSSGVRTIAFSFAGPYGRIFRNQDGSLITEAEISLSPFLSASNGEAYVRASCCDGEGRWAWTNAVGVKL